MSLRLEEIGPDTFHYHPLDRGDPARMAVPPAGILLASSELQQRTTRTRLIT